MPGAAVTVEPVESKTQLRRFRDIPFVLHHDDERWSPGVRAFEQWRTDARRHPYFERGDAAFFLARQGGRPVGRIAAHAPSLDRPRPGGEYTDDGRFGFFDAPDDDDVVDALVTAARTWLDEQGRSSMTGPIGWTAEEEFGVLVSGFEHRSRTGRMWHPEWYAESLRRNGLLAGEERHSFRLRTGEPTVHRPEVVDEEPPPHAGGFADRALVVEGAAAVPDVSATIAGASIRSAWRIARRSRVEGFDTAVCVRCGPRPQDAVPRLVAAAAAADYEWLLAPWAPDDRTPETTHQVFTSRW